MLEAANSVKKEPDIATNQYRSLFMDKWRFVNALVVAKSRLAARPLAAVECNVDFIRDLDTFQQVVSCDSRDKGD